MTVNRLLKKTILISFIGHITVFSIFSFSFGNRIPKGDYAAVSFWGQLLSNHQISQPVITKTKLNPALWLDAGWTRHYFPPKTQSQPILYGWWQKPPLNFAYTSEKPAFLQEPKAVFSPIKRKESTIIFHPLLPYSFTLYFKDRQVAHVELMYKIEPSGLKNSIEIKRKISSGNLEVDLLVSRYIGHYLFIQQKDIPAYNWQTVKIDLSAKND